MEPNPPFQVKALYPFQASQPEDLGFAAGDLITVTRKVDAGWWEGQIGAGKSGLFPSNYVEILPGQLPPQPPRPNYKPPTTAVTPAASPAVPAGPPPVPNRDPSRGYKPPAATPAAGLPPVVLPPHSSPPPGQHQPPAPAVTPAVAYPPHYSPPAGHPYPPAHPYPAQYPPPMHPYPPPTQPPAPYYPPPHAVPAPTPAPVHTPAPTPTPAPKPASKVEPAPVLAEGPSAPAVTRGARPPAGYVPPPPKELKPVEKLGVLRVMFLGDPGVGKTSIINQVMSKGTSFSEVYQPTPYITMQTTTMRFGGGEVDVELYDAPGHVAQTDPNRFSTYATMDAFIVCFSLYDRYTFDDARTRWWEETKYINPAATTKKTGDGRKLYQIIMLCGTKLDLAEHKAQYPEGLNELVTMRREANDFTKLLRAERFVETSARDPNESFESLFHPILRIRFMEKPKGTVDKAKEKAGNTAHNVKSKLGLRI